MTDEKPVKIPKSIDDEIMGMMKLTFVYQMMKLLHFIEVVEPKEKKEDVVTTKN